MLDLRINNIDYLDLEAETAISFTLINPAFDRRGIARTFSYPITLPLSERNRQNLKHAHRMDSQSRKQYVTADIQLQANDFERGRAIVQEYTDRLLEISFQNDNISQIDRLSEINIRDLLGTINIPQTIVAKLVLTPGPGPNWAITINDQLYTAGGLGIDKLVAMNDLADQINTDYPGTADYEIGPDEFILTPNVSPYVVTFSAPDFTLVSETLPSDAQEQNLQAYITTAAAGGEPVAFPVVYARQFYPRNFRYRFYLNHRIDEQYLTNGTDTEFGWATTYVPFVRMRYILDELAAELGFTDIIFDMPTAEAADLDALLIYNNRTLDELRLDYSVAAGQEVEKNTFQTSINLAEHVPDYTAAELLERLREIFNLRLDFERNRLYFRKNRDQVAQPPQDWTARTTTAWQRTTNEGGGVLLAFAADTSLHYSPTHDSYLVGDASNRYELPFRPLHDRTLPLFEANNERWKVVAIEEQTGTSAPLDLETENETLRLFFDRGQQPNETGKLYWQGSVSNTNYPGTEIGALDLALSGANGLYAKFWRGWTQFMFSPTITRVTELDLSTLLLLRSWNNPHVYLYHPDGAVRALVERVQVNLSRKGISMAKVEYRKFEP